MLSPLLILDAPPFPQVLLLVLQVPQAEATGMVATELIEAGSGGVGSTVQSRAGHLVAGEGGVGVEEDAGVVGSVQLSSEDTLGVISSRAGDLNVEALGVVLGTVLGASTVHGNNLVAEDVVAGGEGGGDGSGPGVVVGDEVLGSPDLGGQVDAGLVNLDPLEGVLVGRGAVTVALGDVCEDGSLVGFRPGRPEEVDGAAGGNLDGSLAGCGVLVAVDVGGLVGVGGHESVVEVLSVPTGDLGRGLAVDLGVVVVEEETAVGNTIDAEVGDSAVSEGSGGKSAKERD